MNHDEGSKPEVGSLTGEEVAKHNSKDSCWVIVHGKAYDVTEFLPGRPKLDMYSD
jgi:cytochrome b involved in lipid metabolism